MLDEGTHPGVLAQVDVDHDEEVGAPRRLGERKAETHKRFVACGQEERHEPDADPRANRADARRTSSRDTRPWPDCQLVRSGPTGRDMALGHIEIAARTPR
jgi:hypothetical protein